MHIEPFPSTRSTQSLIKCPGVGAPRARIQTTLHSSAIMAKMRSNYCWPVGDTDTVVGCGGQLHIYVCRIPRMQKRTLGEAAGIDHMCSAHIRVIHKLLI